MTDDDVELRARLARTDPLLRVGAAELPSRSAHEIRERVMQTIDESTSDATPDITNARSRRPALLAAAAVLALVAGIGAFAVLSRDDAKPAAKTTMALTAPDAGGAIGMCMAFDVEGLRPMPVAFAGTVSAVAGDTITLDVDRWYKGGSADLVTVTQPGNATAVALDGVEFTQGTRYLVTATEGVVNGCGFSGPAAAELEQAFAEAFPG